MTSAANPTIDARHLTVRLGGRVALDDVGVVIPSGCLCALVGPNGAGKSTLLRTLAGLLAPDSGQIGHDLASVAYLPQDRTVHWNLDVARTVALGRLQHGPRRLTSADIAAIDREMARMDVAHLAGRPLREVSGGERARVLIARALVQERPVLLADEPVAGLDPAHQLALFETLRAVAREGRTVLVALHDLSLAARYADRVIVLHKGRVAADAEPEQALSTETMGRVFGIEMRRAEIGGVPVVVPIGPLPHSP